MEKLNMPMHRYSDMQQAAIIKAAHAAKQSGNWEEALKAAQEVGFTGSVHHLQDLTQPDGNYTEDGPRQHRGRAQHG